MADPDITRGLTGDHPGILRLRAILVFLFSSDKPMPELMKYSLKQRRNKKVNRLIFNAFIGRWQRRASCFQSVRKPDSMILRPATQFSCHLYVG